MQDFKEKLMLLLLGYGPKLLVALIVLIVGHFLIKFVIALMEKSFGKTKFDVSLVKFLIKSASITLKVILFISVLTTLGVSTTGLLAALSAAAIAISLALKDSLSNLAGGILLLVSRPFATGDFVEVSGISGTVQSIDMIHTTLLTPENTQIVIPNSKMVNERVIDYSKEDCRRMDLTFSIGYDNDTENAKKVILETVNAHAMTMQTPELPFARVSAHSESSVDIAVRVWCKTENYWALHFDLLEQIRAAFDKADITIPYNQLDVRMIERKQID
ncbi:MAG: mechanosensitive ion channel [Oscillospiraceae bacterium]